MITVFKGGTIVTNLNSKLLYQILLILFSNCYKCMKHGLRAIVQQIARDWAKWVCLFTLGYWRDLLPIYTVKFLYITGRDAVTISFLFM